MLSTAVFLFASYVAAVAATISGFGSSALLIPVAVLFMDIKTAVFVATSAMIAVVIDMTRIPIYLFTRTVQDKSYYVLLPFLCVMAYFGVVSGKALQKKLNQETFRRIVSVALLAAGVKILF